MCFDTGGKMDKEKNIVEKSNSLMHIYGEDFGIGEFRLMEIYLSLINPRNSEETAVEFKKKDFEKLYGLDYNIKPDKFKDMISNIMGPVELYHGEKDERGSEFGLINLFSSCRSYKNEKGEWVVRLSCSQEAKKHFFNLENTGYMRYTIGNIVKLNNLPSVYMFEYIINKMKNRQQYEWTEDLEKLRINLNCNTEYYENFLRFNQKILSPAIKKINDTTDFRITTSKVVAAKNKVEAIRFSVTTYKTKSEIIDDEKKKFIKENKSMIDDLKNILKIEDDDAYDLFNEASKQLVSFAELKKRAKYAASQPGIRNVVSYTKKLLEEWSEPVSTSSIGKYNDYHEDHQQSDKILDMMNSKLKK